MRSTTGYGTYLWGNVVTWRSKKEHVVSRSGAEAEVRSLALGICEGVWIRRVLKDLHIMASLPVQIYYTSISPISMSENPVQHDKSKHVEIDRHFIREQIEGNKVRLVHISTKEQIADLLTKPVSTSTFQYLMSKVGCMNIYATKLEWKCGN